MTYFEDGNLSAETMKTRKLDCYAESHRTKISVLQGNPTTDD